MPSCLRVKNGGAWLLYSAAIILGISLSGCVPIYSGVTPSVVGYVEEARTGKPIPGATVSIEHSKQATTITDDKGFYELQRTKGLNLLILGPMDRCAKLNVTCDGYLPARQLFGVDQLCTSRRSINITLEPIKP